MMSHNERLQHFKPMLKWIMQKEYMVYASEPAAIDRVLLGTLGFSRYDW